MYASGGSVNVVEIEQEVHNIYYRATILVSENLAKYGGGIHVSSYAKAYLICLLYTSPSPRHATLSRMPSSA